MRRQRTNAATTAISISKLTSLSAFLFLCVFFHPREKAILTSISIRAFLLLETSRFRILQFLSIIPVKHAILDNPHC